MNDEYLSCDELVRRFGGLLSEEQRELAIAECGKFKNSEEFMNKMRETKEKLEG